MDSAHIGLYEGALVDSATGQQRRAVRWLLRILPLAACRGYSATSAAVMPMYGVSLATSVDELPQRETHSHASASAEPDDDDADELRAATFVRTARCDSDGTLCLTESHRAESTVATAAAAAAATQASTMTTTTYLSIRVTHDGSEVHGILASEPSVVLALRRVVGPNCDADRCDQEEGNVKEADAAPLRLHVQLLCGAAIPAEELEPFMIPSNPIEWLVLCRDSSDGSATSIVAGCGQFVSGDVHGSPTLLFALDRQLAAADTHDDDANAENANEHCAPPVQTLIKRYEPTPETRGVEVVYEVRQQRCWQDRRDSREPTMRPPAMVVFTGTWTNATSCTNGDFFVNSVGFPRGPHPCASAAAAPCSAPPAVTYCTRLRSWCPVGTLLICRTNTAAAAVDDELAAVDVDEHSLMCFDAAFPDFAEEVRVLVKKLRAKAGAAPLPFFFTSLYYPPVLHHSSGAGARCSDLVLQALTSSALARRCLLAICANGQRRGLKQVLYGEARVLVAALVESMLAHCPAPPYSEKTGAVLASPRPCCFVVGPTNNVTTTVALFASVLTGCVTVQVPHTLASVDLAQVLRDVAASSACTPPEQGATTQPQHAFVLVTEPFNILGDATVGCDVLRRVQESLALIRDAVRPSIIAVDEVVNAVEGAGCADRQRGARRALEQAHRIFASQQQQRRESSAADLEHAAVVVLLTSGTTSPVPRGVPYTEALARPADGQAHIAPWVRLDIQPHDPTFVLSLLQTTACAGERLISPSTAAIFNTIAAGQPTHIAAPPTFWGLLAAEYKSRTGASPAQKRAARAHVRKLLGSRATVLTAGGAPLSPHILATLREEAQLPVDDLYGCREAGGIAKNGRVYPGVLVVVARSPSRAVRGNAQEVGVDSEEDEKKEGAATAVALNGTGEALVSSAKQVVGYATAERADLNKTKFVELPDPRTGQQRTFYRTGDVVQLSTDAAGSGAQTLSVIGRLGVSSLKLGDGKWISTAATEHALEAMDASPSFAVSQAAVFISQAGLATRLGEGRGRAAPRPEVHAVVVLRRGSGSFSDGDGGSDETTRVAVELAKRLKQQQQQQQQGGGAPLVLPDRWRILSPSAAFTEHNGQLTGGGKKRHLRIAERYADQERWIVVNETEQTACLVGEMPSGTECGEGREKAASKQGAMPMEVEGAPLHPLLCALIHRSPLAPRQRDGSPLPSSTLADLGADSIFAARLVGALRRTGIPAPPLQEAFAWSLADANRALTAPAAAAASACTGAPAALSLTAVDWTRELQLADTTIDLVSRERRRARSAPRPPQCGHSDVCLIGCTGFLGPAIVASILERMLETAAAPFGPEARIICVGHPQSDAKGRLLRALEAYADAAFQPDSLMRVLLRDREFLAARLCVVEADLGGLASPLHEEDIADTIGPTASTVILNAARVADLAPYAALRSSNVALPAAVGAVCAARGIPLTFISSTAALPPSFSSSNSSECSVAAGAATTDFSLLAHAKAFTTPAMLEGKLRDGNAYGASKAVAEFQLALLVEREGLRCSVIRPSLIAPPAPAPRPSWLSPARASAQPWRYQNASDSLYMLLSACAHLSVAAGVAIENGREQAGQGRSCHPTRMLHVPAGARVGAHIDYCAIPVNCVAEVVVAAAAAASVRSLAKDQSESSHFNIARHGPTLCQIIGAAEEWGTAPPGRPGEERDEQRGWVVWRVPMDEFALLVNAARAAAAAATLEDDDDEAARWSLAVERLRSFPWLEEPEAGEARSALPCMAATERLVGAASLSKLLARAPDLRSFLPQQ